MKFRMTFISVLFAAIALTSLCRATMGVLAAPKGGDLVDNLPNVDVIYVQTEPGGDMDVVTEGGLPDGINENVLGALFWNGSRWVTNGTAAHTYFTDINGVRLENYNLLATLDGSGSPGIVFTQWGFTVTQSVYTYTVFAADYSGIYRYQGTQYVITSQLPREKYILRSRGTGNGTLQPYFDVFIQENYTYTLAFRGDPVLYSYDNTTAEQALLITSHTQGRIGYLPTYTPTARAQYWLDINGGSDMGGLTFYFRTSQLAAVLTENLGYAFPTEFRVKFMDGNSQLEEFTILPKIISETFIPATITYLEIPLVQK